MLNNQFYVTQKTLPDSTIQKEHLALQRYMLGQFTQPEQINQT
jgi:hypothetical protein